MDSSNLPLFIGSGPNGNEVLKGSLNNLTINEVSKETVTTIPVSGITLDSENLTLNIGESKTLIHTISPSNATNQNVTWTSSDESVVTAENGVIAANKEGNAIVSVTTADGGFIASVNVTVKKVEIDNVKPNKVKELSASDINSNSLKLTWNKPSNTQIKEYIVYKDSKELSRVFDTEFTVDNLKANTVYSFKIVAVGENNLLSKPASIGVRTLK